MNGIKKKMFLSIVEIKKKVLNFIQNLTGQTIYDKIYMGENEYKEFQKFILEREPDYEDYMQ